MRPVVVGTLLWFASVLPAQFHLPGTGSPDSPPKVKSAPAPPAPPAPSPPSPAPQTGRFDYYALTLSWTGAGFSVSGLSPQAAEGPSPESCGSPKRPSKAVISLVLPLMKNEALIRREWQTHGSCTGLSPGDYFTNIRLARSQVQIPVQVSSVDEPATETPARIKGQFAAANPGFPESAFRVACARGRLSEVRVCFDLLMKARACGASVPECTAPFFTTGPLR